MAESSLPTTKTEALYQKDGHKYTHTAPISTIQPLSSLPEDTQSLFKPPPEGTSDPHIITTPSTIFHAQGGGQPSDTGTITAGACTFTVHQVRRAAPSILHMGTFSDDARFTPEEPAHQHIDTAKRILHSRIHTAGHVIGLAAAALRRSGALAADVVDGKASHYPGAAFVEFVGLIPGTLKAAIQTQTDELVARDLPVRIHFWDEARARALHGRAGELQAGRAWRARCRDWGCGYVCFVLVCARRGLIVAGSYPCGGTHVKTTGECGRIVLRNIKRQKGITKVSYEVQDA